MNPYTGVATVENSMEFPQKTENRTTTWSSSPTYWYLSEESKNTNSKRYICTQVFITVLFTVGKIWKQLKCSSVDEWIKKIRYRYAMDYYSTIARWNFATCHNMDSLVAQRLKHLPAMRETQVQTLGGEDGNDNTLQYSCLENPIDEGAW